MFPAAVALITIVYVPAGVFAAALMLAVVFVGIVKYVTFVLPLFCDWIAYVNVPCAFVAAVNALLCALVENVMLPLCVAVTLIGLAVLFIVNVPFTYLIV